MVRILICDSIHEDGVKMLIEAGFQVDLDTSITPEELIEKIPGYDAIVIRSRTKVRKDVLEAATNLKAVARAGVGLDNVDLVAAKELGVKVINSSEQRRRGAHHRVDVQPCEERSRGRRHHETGQVGEETAHRL
jgi:D-3-phosphoglycerate dehydrogenase